VPPDLLTLGEAFEDLIFLDLSHLPRPGEEIRTDHFVRTVGGGAVITAVAARRLGLSCGTWSALADTGAARLRAEGVAVTNLRRPGELHAISAALSTSENRSFVTFDGVNGTLESRLLARADRIRCRHAHFAIGPRRCARWLPVLDTLRKRGIATSWDFAWNERLLDDPELPALMQGVDVLFLNEQEALLYSRRRTRESAFRYWRQTQRTVVVKLGAQGSRWISPGQEFEVPAPKVRPVDTTGAGDAFNGGFIAASLTGRTPRQRLRLGNRMGALSTRKAGGLDALPDLR
jgi:sugar/nucleoside kinase (ribokinase family)